MSSVNVEQLQTVLVVEDQAPVRKVVERSLLHAQLNVLSVGSPREGLELIEQRDGRIDLLLTDVVLPGMTGPELVAQARALNPKLKVLFMSGYTVAFMGADVASFGDAAFMEKPFRPMELINRVRQLLGE